MEKTVKLASPLVFLVVSIWLFVEAGFFSTPANDSMTDSLVAKTNRLEEILTMGTLPSVQALTDLQERREALLAQKADFGTIAREPSHETLQSILKEWGYRPEDPMSRALHQFEEQLLSRLEADFQGSPPDARPQWQGAVRAFVNDLARKAAESDLYMSLTLEIAESSSPGDADHPRTLPVFTVAFSFISGIAEAVQFIESWTLDAPPGVFVKPGQIGFQRVEPDLWGSSLRYFSGPPVRTDLSCTAVLNLENP